MGVERESIEHWDVFGDQVVDCAAEQWIEHGSINASTKYLICLSHRSNSEFIRTLPEATN